MNSKVFSCDETIESAQHRFIPWRIITSSGAGKAHLATSGYVAGYLGVQYSWIGRPIEPTKKQFFNEPEGLHTINPRPRMKSSRREESRSTGYIFLWSFLTSYFLKQVKTWCQQKYTQQIWIRLVEYSSSKVSGPSKVPRFVSKLIFS